MSDSGMKRSINIFKPLQGTMSSEVTVIALLLVACLLAVVGTQVGIWFLEESLDGFWLTELIFFNLPIHFWISGQFLPLFFIVLGLVFNLWMDRNELRRMEGTIRFRAPGRKKGEVP
jgi:uncharacterized membrane protein